MDYVSIFVSSINSSLRVGTIRCCKFNFEFRLDVFKFLFGGKGQQTQHQRGMDYNKEDFDSKYFSTDWHVHYDRLGNGCEVDFPIHLYPSIKFSARSYFKDANGKLTPKLQTFTETLTVTVLKRRCD